MAYLTTQKQDGGRYTTLYATVATWSDLKGGRRGAVQQRFYVGRLNADSGKVRVSKGLAGGARVEVDLEVLRRQVKEAGSVAGVEAWLRGLCRAATGLSAAAVGPPHGDLDTALLGPTYVLGEIAHASGLRRCLAEAFGEGSGLALLYLAMHQAVRGEPLRLGSAWMGDLWLPTAIAAVDFSAPGLSRLLDAVSCEETRQAFYQAWMAARRQPPGLVYDTTSLAALGHNRGGEALPQVNLALACDRADGLPLFCRLVPGSVPDVVALDVTAQRLRALGMKDIEFALGQGFYSNSNARELLLKEHRFALGVRLGCPQSTGLLARYRTALNSPKRSIFHEGRSLRHVGEVWTVDMGWDERGKRRADRDVEAHLFFDPRQHADYAAALDEKVFALEAKAARETFADPGEARRWLAENADQLAPCLGLEKGAAERLLLRRRPRAIAARAANTGFELVICDTPGRDAAAVLSDYRSRDRLEKLFELLRNEDEQHSPRRGPQSLAEGRVFLAFLALVLRADVENRLRAAGLLKEITVTEFLAEMGSIRVLRLPAGSRLLRPLSPRQREWLAAVGLPPPTP
jgi:hypothetical protein